MNILVTGGAGFIGSHTVDLLLERGHSVRILDALAPQVHGPDPRRPLYLDRRAQLNRGCVEDYHAVCAALDGVDSVIHLAASVGVGQSMYRIVDYTHTNVMGTAVLWQAIVDLKLKLRSFVVASSMSAYGEGRYRAADGSFLCPEPRSEAQLLAGDWRVRDAEGAALEPAPTDESKPLQPSSVYAIQKRDQEEMCLVLGNAYAIPATALRLFNVYGARQALSNPYTGVAAIFCARLLNGAPPLVFEDGCQRRDFVHVTDVAWAMAMAVENPAAGEAINIGSGESVTILEVAKILARQMGSSLAPQIAGRYRKGDIRHCFADISKARRLLGWKPKMRFEDGVAEIVTWVQSQREAGDSVSGAWSELASRGLLT